ncbi:MAG: HAD family phosphatase, partial [Acidimicrobiales bacterium]|nr:HAD family phosphatase [Acidimicrobiales bacterium]
MTRAFTLSPPSSGSKVGTPYRATEGSYRDGLTGGGNAAAGDGLFHRGRGWRWSPTISAKPSALLNRLMTIDAILFDLDGVLIDSESVWNVARRDISLQHGGRWPAEAQQTMMGMSSLEWSRYMHDELGVRMPPTQISETVVARMQELYREDLPLLPGARQTVTTLGRVWPLGLASSANRPIIDLVLGLARLGDQFVATVSSEEVPQGKPAPDVYLEAARRMGVAPERCAAIEDSGNGVRSGVAAGMTVIAVPNREFPPTKDALA